MSFTKKTPKVMDGYLNPYSQIAIVIISAFGFLLAISWNATISEILEQKFGRKGNIKVHIIYSMIITIIGIIAIYLVVKYTDIWLAKTESEEQGIIIGRMIEPYPPNHYNF